MRFQVLELEGETIIPVETDDMGNVFVVGRHYEQWVRGGILVNYRWAEGNSGDPRDFLMYGGAPDEEFWWASEESDLARHPDTLSAYDVAQYVWGFGGNGGAPIEAPVTLAYHHLLVC